MLAVHGFGALVMSQILNEPGRSSADAPPNAPVVDTCLSHQCIDKEARLELLRQKGKKWGDDEIRFHLQHMLHHPQNVSKSQFSVIPGFVMLDPLLLTTWDSIGELMCSAWCRRNACVAEQGFHVVAAFLHNDHWFPLWIVPHGRTIVAHVVQDDVIDHAIVLPVLEVLRQQFGFQEKVLNSHPSRLPAHSLCGAAAVAFLGHIMVAADLPDDLDTLADCHSNMKAAFVQALFDSKCCICPVAWGSGPQLNLVKQLADELSRHGVSTELTEQRAQQALKAIGGDQIQQALESKNVWRSFKAQGNNVKFQFLLPHELASVVAANKGAQVGKRTKGPAMVTRPKAPDRVDPSRLALPDGVFHADGHN